MYRKELIKTGILTIALLGSMQGLSIAEDYHKYVGVKKCGMCHKDEKKGNQLKKWEESRHSQAYHTLGTEKAKEVAQKRGVSGNPQEALECLKCHVTAFGVDEFLLNKKYSKEDGVQCETCHGPGGDYSKSSIMKDRGRSLEKGLILPTKEACIKCHNEESPNFEGFDFEVEFEKIRHPRPKVEE